MALPRTKLPTRKVKLTGGEVTLRGLTRAEALALSGFGEDIPGFETQIIAFAFDVHVDEAAVWYTGAPSADVQGVIKVVTDLSGLTGDAGKASSAG